jgi:hypothetical protein
MAAVAGVSRRGIGMRAFYPCPFDPETSHCHALAHWTVKNEGYTVNLITEMASTSSSRLVTLAWLQV